MTPIPDDHLAAKDLQQQLEERGRERSRARRRSPRGTRRTLGISIAVLAVLAAGAGATKVFIVDAGDVPSERDAPRDVSRVPGDVRLSPARIADPTGNLPWGARTYISRSGESCVVVGRLRAGRLGVLRRGRFKRLPDDAPGACAPLATSDEALVARRVDGDDPSQPRTVIYGLVGRDVRAIDIQAAKHRTNVPIARDGVFLAVFASAPRPTTVTLVGEHGTERRRLP